MTPEDEGIPDPDEQPPGVDTDLAQEGIVVPGDAPRAAGHWGETAAEQRAGAPGGGVRLRPGPERNLIDDELATDPASRRVDLRRRPGDPAWGQLTGDEDDPDAFALVGDDEGIGPEERAMSIVEEPSAADPADSAAGRGETRGRS